MRILAVSCLSLFAPAATLAAEPAEILVLGRGLPAGPGVPA